MKAKFVARVPFFAGTTVVGALASHGAQ